MGSTNSVGDGVCSPPLESSTDTRDRYYGNSAFYDYPVIMVDWHQADAYCRWAVKRLPTEAEWEKAARGTDKRIYPWGDGVPNEARLNYNENVGDTTEVGSYPGGASPYGALDMAGNVWEWVADWYDGKAYQKRAGGETPHNPTGPESGRYRVMRGGSWHTKKQRDARAAYRFSSIPTSFTDTIGFRCARDS